VDQRSPGSRGDVSRADSGALPVDVHRAPRIARSQRPSIAVNRSSAANRSTAAPRPSAASERRGSFDRSYAFERREPVAPSDAVGRGGPLDCVAGRGRRAA